MDTHTGFVVTPWRNSDELLALRHELYGADALKREKAVIKIFAWRLRKPDGLPLLLDSTADIVDAILQDERGGLKHNVSRLLFATALSRFITGLADTQIDLTRDKPTWFLPGKSLQLPLSLLEIRHRIVHRHLPSLAELKNAAQESLDWLWEWYWSQLDSAFGDTQAIDNILVSEDIADVREKLHSLLKTYVKDRKSEIKARKYKGDEQAAESTISTYTLRFAPSSTTIPSARIQAQLLQMLVGEKMVLPAEKKLNSSMAGAFLIWTPLLVGMAMTAPGVLLVKDVLDSLLDAMNSSTVSRTMMDVELDPVREGMAEWIVHILGSQDWQAVRDQWGRRLIDDTLVRCLTEPTVWNLKVVERFFEDGGSENREHWKAVLEAARGGETTTAEQDGEAMDVDIEGILEGLPVKAMEDMVVKEKIKGPQKVFGMWKAKPIGWLPEGWEDDE